MSALTAGRKIRAALEPPGRRGNVVRRPSGGNKVQVQGQARQEARSACARASVSCIDASSLSQDSAGVGALLRVGAISRDLGSHLDRDLDDARCELARSAVERAPRDRRLRRRILRARGCVCGEQGRYLGDYVGESSAVRPLAGGRAWRAKCGDCGASASAYDRHVGRAPVGRPCPLLLS